MTAAQLVRRAKTVVRARFSRPGALEAFSVFLALLQVRDHPRDPACLSRLANAIAAAGPKSSRPMEAHGPDRPTV